MQNIEDLIDDLGITGTLEEMIRYCYSKNGEEEGRWLSIATILDDAATRIDLKS